MLSNGEIKWLTKNSPQMSVAGSKSSELKPSWFGKTLPIEDGIREACGNRVLCAWGCEEDCNMYSTAVIKRDKSRRTELRDWIKAMQKEIIDKPRQSKVDNKRIGILDGFVSELMG